MKSEKACINVNQKVRFFVGCGEKVFSICFANETSTPSLIREGWGGYLHCNPPKSSLSREDLFSSLRGGFADGRSETSSDSEQIEQTATKLLMRNSVSVEQIQDSSIEPWQSS